MALLASLLVCLCVCVCVPLSHPLQVSLALSPSLLSRIFPGFLALSAAPPRPCPRLQPACLCSYSPAPNLTDEISLPLWAAPLPLRSVLSLRSSLWQQWACPLSGSKKHTHTRAHTHTHTHTHTEAAEKAPLGVTQENEGDACLSSEPLLCFPSL